MDESGPSQDSPAQEEARSPLRLLRPRESNLNRLVRTKKSDQVAERGFQDILSRLSRLSQVSEQGVTPEDEEAIGEVQEKIQRLSRLQREWGSKCKEKAQEGNVKPSSALDAFHRTLQASGVEADTDLQSRYYNIVEQYTSLVNSAHTTSRQDTAATPAQATVEMQNAKLLSCQKELEEERRKVSSLETEKRRLLEKKESSKK